MLKSEAAMSWPYAAREPNVKCMRYVTRQNKATDLKDLV
jgi:hypothetical protein